jgi:anthranilate phosphoribosyltransferase
MMNVGPSWDRILSLLDSGTELPVDHAHWAMTEILEGKTENVTIKSFLLGMKSKGETSSEVNALVEAMYAQAHLIEIPERAVDIVGTGGDGLNTINISTAAAIVTTAAGARTIKHGNRAATSKSGAADLLQKLGIEINLDADAVAKCVQKIGIGFAFAPQFHGAMRHAAQARKELGVPTIFNILGPLANPARPQCVAIGVARSELIFLVAEVLARRGCEGFVFRGNDGLDEISISTTTRVLVIRQGEIREELFDPSEIGLENFSLSALVGGTPEENAEITRAIFDGKSGAHREAVLINAAASIAAFKGEFGLGVNQQFANGYVLAKQAVDSGAASHLLERWAVLSNELAKRSL